MIGTNKMREEFEYSLVHMFISDGLTPSAAKETIQRNNDGTYANPSTSGAWWGWQASRQAVVVELPEERKARGYGEQVADALGFNDALSECWAAIEAEGLRVGVRT